MDTICEQARKVLIILGIAFGPWLIAAGIFALKHNQVAVAICLTIAAMLALGGMLAFAYAAGGRSAVGKVHLGADLMLRMLESEKRAQASLENNMTKLFTEGARAVKMLAPPERQALPPLPSQTMDWLPELDVPAEVELLDSGEWK